MGILSKLLPGKTEAAIMRRTLPDGKVEYYCDRPSKSKAKTKPEWCATHSTAEERLKPHEIETEEAWSTGKREYFRVGDDLVSRPVSEHSSAKPAKSPKSTRSVSEQHATKMSSSKSGHERNTPRDSRESSNRASRNISRSGNQSTENGYCDKASSRSLASGLVTNGDNNNNNNNVGLQAGSSNHQSRGNIVIDPTATPYRPSLRDDAGTLSYREEEDLHRAIQASLVTFDRPRALPRSDFHFTAEEQLQASWEERQWRAIQEDECATARRRRRRRTSCSSETYRGMSSSVDSHRLRRRSGSSRNEPAYRRSTETGREARICAPSTYESCAPSEYHDGRSSSDFERENSRWYSDRHGHSGRAYRQVGAEIYNDSFIYAGEGVHGNFQFLGYGYTD